MKRILLTIGFILSLAVYVQAQGPSVAIKTVTTLPSTCRANATYTEMVFKKAADATRGFYTCKSTQDGWAGPYASSGGATPGTVTSVTGATNQIDVATGTTTPALTLSATIVAPGTITATTSIASPFYKTTASDPADAGAIRLGNNEFIEWEKATPGTDWTLGVNASDVLIANVDFSALTLTGQGLTSGRVPIVTTSGKITDDGDMTFATDTLTVTKLIVGGGSALTSTGAGGALGTNAFTSTAYVPTSTTVNGKALSGNITLSLASADFANQGTTATVLHGNASGNPSFAAVALGTDVSGTLLAAQEPAHTGDVTNSAGSLALSIAANAVTLAKLATQATNTVLGNATSGTAVPTALAVGTCSTAGSALIWTTNTGFGCNTSITANTANTATTATTATNATNTAITDDTTTNATMYPTWVTTTTGNLPQKVSSSKLTFNPSTGTLTTTTVVAAVTGTASGNVTAVSVATANGVSGSSSGGQTPALTVTLGAITPSSVAATGAVTASASSAGAYIAQFTNSSSTGFGVNIQTTANDTSRQVLQVLGNAGAIIGLQVRSDGHVFVPTLSTDSGATDTTACVRTSDGELLKGSGTLGICLGTSSARFKTDIKALPVGLAQIMALQPVQYYLDEKHGDPNKLFYGFTAEWGGRVLPALMGRDANGLPNTFDYLGVVPVLVRGMQQQQVIIQSMQKEIDALKRHDY